jgi:hypothetical protein
MKPTASDVLGLFLSGIACFAPSLGALTTDSALNVASLRGRATRNQQSTKGQAPSFHEQTRSLQNPPIGTDYCYPLGNNTAVDD